MLDAGGELTIPADHNIAPYINAAWNFGDHLTSRSKQNAGPSVFKLLTPVKMNLFDSKKKKQKVKQVNGKLFSTLHFPVGQLYKLG